MAIENMTFTRQEALYEANDIIFRFNQALFAHDARLVYEARKSLQQLVNDLVENNLLESDLYSGSLRDVLTNIEHNLWVEHANFV